MRMRPAAAAAVCTAVLVGVVAAQSPLAKHPIVGRWKLKPAESTVGTVLTFTNGANGSMTMAVGSLKYTFKIDGKEYPVPADTTATWTQKGTNQWETVYKLQGKVDNTDRISLTPDGKTLAIYTDRVQPKAKEEMVLQRVSGGPGLAGVWRTTLAAFDQTVDYSVTGDKLSAHVEPGNERWTGPLDGKDYPIAPTPGLPASITWAGRQDGPRAIKFVIKDKGTPIQFATLTVLPDGKTLEIIQINGATEASPERNRLIFER